jgi:hypothetical protein
MMSFVCAITQALFDNLLEYSIFAQNVSILTLTLMDRGYLPNFSYTIKFGVELLKLRICLQNFKCNLSMRDKHESPHISHPYKRIG